MISFLIFRLLGVSLTGPSSHHKSFRNPPWSPSHLQWSCLITWYKCQNLKEFPVLWLAGALCPSNRTHYGTGLNRWSLHVFGPWVQPANLWQSYWMGLLELGAEWLRFCTFEAFSQGQLFSIWISKPAHSSTFKRYFRSQSKFCLRPSVQKSRWTTRLKLCFALQIPMCRASRHICGRMWNVAESFGWSCQDRSFLIP